MTKQVLVRFIHTDDGDLHGRVIKEYPVPETNSIKVSNRRSVISNQPKQVQVIRRRRPSQQDGQIGLVVFLLGYTKNNKDQWNGSLPKNRSYWICEIERKALDYKDSQGRHGLIVRLVRETKKF